MTTIPDKTVRNFTRVRVQLMRSDMFVALAPVMMVGKRELTTTIPTACTNGRDEQYNPDFIFQWSDKEAGFIIMHENMHKAARHLEVYEQLHRLHHRAANMACDYWINQKLLDADPQKRLIAMPLGANGKPIGLIDPKYKGWTVKQIFDDLRQQQREDKEKGEGEGEGGGEGGSEGKDEGEGDGGGGMDDHDWDGAKGMSEEDKKELKEDIDRAIREGIMAAKKAGMTGGGNALGLDELIAPQVNWVEQLKDFVRSTCKKKEVSTWRKMSRRYLANSIVMPSLQGNSIKELVVAPDASGSMFWAEDGSTRNAFQVCMSEVEGLARQLSVDKLHLIYWDGWVARHEEYTATTIGNWKQSTRPSGGGGTDPSCVPAYLKEKGIKPDAVVVLTDGEVLGWGVWSCPVLWCIKSGAKRITAPVGKTIHVM